jgi:hypothetical protein
VAGSNQRGRIGSFLLQIISGLKKTVKLAASGCIYDGGGLVVRAAPFRQGIATLPADPNGPFFHIISHVPVIPASTQSLDLI